MASIELTTWLLGIGGYAGIFGAFAFIYMYPNFPKYYMPLLTLMPLASAGAFYLFFQTLYTLLGFAANVIDAMLNENITIVLITSAVLGGQILLLTVVVYHNVRRPAENLEDEVIEAEDIRENDAYEAVDGEAPDGEAAEATDGEAPDGEAADGEAPDASDGIDDGDNDDGEEKKDTEASCENCEADCIKCMPALIQSDISGDVIPLVTPLPVNSVVSSLPLTIDYMNLWSNKNNTADVSI